MGFPPWPRLAHAAGPRLRAHDTVYRYPGASLAGRSTRNVRPRLRSRRRINWATCGSSYSLTFSGCAYRHGLRVTTVGMCKIFYRLGRLFQVALMEDCASLRLDLVDYAASHSPVCRLIWRTFDQHWRL